MKYSITKKIQDDNYGGRKFEGAELGVQDADSIEQAFEALDKLIEHYEKYLESDASGILFENRRNKEPKVELKDIPF